MPLSNRDFLAEYTADCTKRMNMTDFDALGDIVDIILNTKKTGCRIYTAGNGGSAATASHICNDLTKGCRVLGRPGFMAECLADSTAVVTCLGNDYGYDEIYTVPIETKGRAGDVLICFSGSGNSENVVRAAELARKKGITTVGFLGRDGGKLKDLCDKFVIAPTDNMEKIEDMHMLYCHAISSLLQQKLKDIWDMEIIEPCRGRKFTAALFDFDGTVSLIRSGWQGVMIPYFIEVLEATPRHESHDEIVTCVTDFVDFLTGKQTIFQCMRLDEEVVARGGEHRDPVEYKHEYLRRLEIHIKDRKKALESGADPSLYRVPGCYELVCSLKEKGIKCYLASGTDEKDVLYEAGLLGLDKGVFDGGIHGAQDYMLECSKELVIRDMMEKEGIDPRDLVSFGDGYVEIELVANLGGYAVGAATDEDRRYGINEWKRNRLKKAGAAMIIPDFSETGRLMRYLGGED
ncbi:MAG: SIS domain-containing protein [Clostridia bacterium]|nr:SIS domain-containing protein [Clostridia bacterium]